MVSLTRWILKVCFIIGLQYPQVISAQSQLQIQKNDVGYGSRSNPTFNDRYHQFYHTSYVIDKTDYYKQKRVKKLLLYDSYSNALTFMVEFDSTGKVIKRGILGVRYFIVTISDTDANNTRRNITNFYQNEELVRTDTTFIEDKYFTYKDTVYTFIQTITRSYKCGSLINEQNTYYNLLGIHKAPKYLWHSKRPMRYLRNYLVTEIGKLTYRSSGINKKSEYVVHKHWRKKFANNFVSDSLYLCLDKADYQVTGYILDSTKHLILSNHKKFDSILKQNKVSFKIPGENYIEKTISYTPMYCGFARSQEQEIESITTYKYSENANGLHETYFWEQVDKSDKNQKHSAIIYRFEYEYFK